MEAARLLEHSNLQSVLHNQVEVYAKKRRRAEGELHFAVLTAIHASDQVQALVEWSRRLTSFALPKRSMLALSLLDRNPARLGLELLRYPLRTPSIHQRNLVLWHSVATLLSVTRCVLFTEPHVVWIASPSLLIDAAKAGNVSVLRAGREADGGRYARSSMEVMAFQGSIAREALACAAGRWDNYTQRSKRVNSVHFLDGLVRGGACGLGPRGSGRLPWYAYQRTWAIVDRNLPDDVRSLWERVLSFDPSAVGNSIRQDQQSLTVQECRLTGGAGNSAARRRFVTALSGLETRLAQAPGHGATRAPVDATCFRVHAALVEGRHADEAGEVGFCRQRHAAHSARFVTTNDVAGNGILVFPPQEEATITMDHPCANASALTRRSCYRIPSVVQTADGVLVAFAEARRGDWAAGLLCHDDGAREIVSRSSTDGGATWSPMTIVVGSEDYHVSNPVATVTASGRVIMVFSMHSRSCFGPCVTGVGRCWSDDGGR
eukprot:7385900-Prymnesium_polylepis.1